MLSRPVGAPVSVVASLSLLAACGGGGQEAFVECRTADDGELVVPAAVLDLLIEAGETGIGSYIENAWLLRDNQATADTELGCAAFQSVSRHFIAIDVERVE